MILVMQNPHKQNAILFAREGSWRMLGNPSAVGTVYIRASCIHTPLRVIFANDTQTFTVTQAPFSMATPEQGVSIPPDPPTQVCTARA